MKTAHDLLIEAMQKIVVISMDEAQNSCRLNRLV